MNAAVLAWDDEWQAPGEALRYVKESLSSIRRGGGVEGRGGAVALLLPRR